MTHMTIKAAWGSLRREMLALCAVALWLAFSHAQAAPILLVDVNGKLTGATGVDVGGTLYNVQFLDGTCVALFSGCDAVSDFVFQTEISATAASQALLDQVFLDTPQGAFDTQPALTAGCSDPIGCIALTPFGLLRTFGFEDPPILSDFVVVFQGVNCAPDPAGCGADFLWGQTLLFTDSRNDSAIFTQATYARWSPQDASVPEPGTIAILGVGLVGLILTRRRRTQDLDRVQ